MSRSTKTPSPSKRAQPTARHDESWQSTSVHGWVPFVADLFEREPLRIRRGEPLPVRRPEALTKEALEAAAGAITCGSVAFLCRRGGWRAINVSLPGAERPQTRTRVTAPEIWRASPQGQQLRFGQESIDAALLLYNAICYASGKRPAKFANSELFATAMPAQFERAGDLIAHHVCWARVHEAPFRIEQATWEYLSKTNPLTCIARLDARTFGSKRTAQKGAHDYIARLMRPDMQPLWPWLAPHLVACWERELATRWDSLRRFDRLNEGMAALFGALLEYARREERIDLCRPLVSLFLSHFADEEAPTKWEASFGRLARELKIADRQRYRNTWAEAIETAWQLWEIYREARAPHPIDRLASEAVYMGRVEGTNLEEVAWRARRFGEQLRGVIS